MSTMTATRDLSHFVRHLDGGVARMELELDGLPHAGCTQAIEGVLAAIPDITLARVNLVDRRVAVEWRDGKVDPARFINRLSELGYEAHPCDAARPAAGDAYETSALLYGLGVALLAAFAIELLSVLAGPDAVAGSALRGGTLFRWLPAAIAVPAAVWAARPFLTSAARAAAAGRLSREAPVSVAVVLVFGLSLGEALGVAAQAFYDWGLILLAAALILCVLERAAQQQPAPAAGGSTAADAGDTVTAFITDTELAEVPVASVRPGDLILVRPGARIAVDGVVIDGRSEVDQSRVTGETLPVAAGRDSAVFAGTINVSGTLRVRVGSGAGALPDGVPCMPGRVTAAIGAESLSERAARLYPPLALAAALMTLVGRTAFGADWHDAAIAAIAVLVAMHPAALSLTVSAVRTWAARALSREGLLLKAQDGLERLAGVDTIVFDKTGTLTAPEPEVINTADIPPERLALAGRLALSSRHPLARAVVRAAGAKAPLYGIEEPGQGIRCIHQGIPLRLGRPSFCDADRRAAAMLETDPEASVIAFAYGAERHVLAVRQRLRPDAIETLAHLMQQGFAVEILSGDRAPAVAHTARMLGIARWHAGMTPADKIGHIRVLQARGRTVLMVGDGLNDAPSLAAADAALSVGAAGPLTLAAVDAVVAGERLAPVLAAVAIAHRAQHLRRRNLLLAAVCMTIAAPAAGFGLAPPLLAALAPVCVAAAVALSVLRQSGLCNDLKAGTDLVAAARINVE